MGFLRESKLKETLMMELQNTARLVQSMDQIYWDLHKNRQNYTNEEVFLNVLQILMTASEGVSLMKILHKYCYINKEEFEYIEELMKGYNEIRDNLLVIYREHSKNTEELY